MPELRFRPWVGSSGVVASVVLDPPAPVNGVLAAAAQAATFAGSGVVAGTGVNAVLAAQAQASGFACVVTTGGGGWTLDAQSQPATFAGTIGMIASAVLAAQAQAAAFAGAATTGGAPDTTAPLRTGQQDHCLL
jgi:hypothetical protein